MYAAVWRNSIIEICRWFEEGWVGKLNPRTFLTFWQSLSEDEKEYYRKAPLI